MAYYKRAPETVIHQYPDGTYTLTPLDRPIKPAVGTFTEIITSPRPWVLYNSLMRSHWVYTRFEVVRSRDSRTGKMETGYVVREERVLSDDEVAWCLEQIRMVEGGTET